MEVYIKCLVPWLLVNAHVNKFKAGQFSIENAKKVKSRFCRIRKESSDGNWYLLTLRLMQAYTSISSKFSPKQFEKSDRILEKWYFYMTILDYILLKYPGKSLKNWIGKSYPTQLTHLTLHKQTITCSQNWPFNSKRKASTTSNIQNRQFRTSFYPWRQSSLLKGLMIYLQYGTLSWSVMAHILLIKTFSFF